MKNITLLLALIVLSAIKIYSQEPTQTIRGVVLDKAINTPLIGATVRLVNESGRGAVTDNNGSFKIGKVPVGRHDLKITYVGYNDAMVSNIYVISGKEVFLNIKMEENAVQSAGVVVSAVKDITKANNDLIANSVTNLRPETINRFAGSRSDPSKMASSTAGVASNDNRRNDIIVRGNSSLGVIWRLEDVDIPNPNHFTVAATGGGIFPVINNNLLSNCDFLTGAFPAEYGNGTAAAFDIKLRNGNNEKHEYTLQAGLSGLEADAEGPILSETGASYLASFRYLSTRPIVAMGIDLSANTAPEFMDGALKLNVPTKQAGTFSLWAIGGNSKASVKDSEEDDIDWTVTDHVEDENINSTMYAAGFSHTYLFGDRTLGRLNLSRSASIIKTNNDFVFSDKSQMLSERYDGTEGQNIVSYTLTHKLSASHLFKAGASLKNMFYDDNFLDYETEDSAYYTRLDMKGDANLVQAFMHWQYRITEDIESDLGVHYQLFTLNNKFAVEPRFSLSWQASENQRFSLAYGLHSQTHPLLYYFYRFERADGRLEMANKNLDFTRSHHFALGYNNRLSEHLWLKAEAYYQYLFDVPVSLVSSRPYYSFVNLGAEFSFNPEDSTVNQGKARNYGLEITLEKTFADDYYILLTGSFIRSKYTGADKVERNSAFDIGHVVNLLAGKEFKLDDENRYVLSTDIKMTYSGGRRVIPVDVEKSRLAGYQVRDTKNAFSQKLDDNFQLDLKITLNINMQNTTHNIYLAADNLLNTKNPISQEWNRYRYKIVYEYQLGLFPYLGYRVNF